jgi:hypothetical protein
MAAGPAIPGGTHTLTASDPVGTLTAAGLDVEVGAADLTVVGDNTLGAELYKAVVTYSGAEPKVTLDESSGVVLISQQGEFGIFGSRHLTIDLHVNPAVAWSFSLNTGATNATLNLTGVKVTSVEANNGAIRLDLTAGPPKGVVPIRISGGAPNLRFHRPGGVAVSVQLSGAALNLTADGHHTGAIGRQVEGGAPNLRFHRPGGVAVSVQLSGAALNLTADGHHTGAIGRAAWQSDGFAGVADAYAIEVKGGACNVTIDNSVPAA